MDDLTQKREAVKKAYPHSGSWQKRVERMSDAQVSAIYIRLQAQGKLGK